MAGKHTAAAVQRNIREQERKNAEARKKKDREREAAKKAAGESSQGAPRASMTARYSCANDKKKRSRKGIR